MEMETSIKIEVEPDDTAYPSSNLCAELQTTFVKIEPSVTAIDNGNQEEQETILPDNVNVSLKTEEPRLFVQAWAHEPDDIEPPPELLVSRKNDKFHDFVSIPDKVVPPRARAVIPNQLIWKKNAVYANQHSFPSKTCFGPVEGVSKNVSLQESKRLAQEAAAKNEPVFIVTNDDGTVTHIDTSDQDKSNWISLLKLGNNDSDNMLWLCQNENKLYAVTLASLSRLKPLKLGYSKEYADQYGIPDDQPILDLYAAQTEHWCHLCSAVLSTQLAYTKHMKRCRRMVEKSLATGIEKNIPVTKKCAYTRKLQHCQYCFQSYRGKLSGFRIHENICAQRNNKDAEGQLIKTPLINNTDSGNLLIPHETVEEDPSNRRTETEMQNSYSCPACNLVLASKVSFDHGHKWRCKKFIEASSKRKSQRVPKNTIPFKAPSSSSFQRPTRPKYPCACGLQFKILEELRLHIAEGHRVHPRSKSGLNIFQARPSPKTNLSETNQSNDHVLSNLGLVKRRESEPETQNSCSIFGK